MPQTTRGEILSALRQLRQDVAAAVSQGAGRVLALDCAAVDGVLAGGGLGLGALHEVSGEAAGGFAAALLGRHSGPVLWCAAGSRGRVLYPPGLMRFGLDPDRLVLANAGARRDALWVAEEAMKSGALGAVVLEADFTVPLALSRRLQLSVEASRCLGLLLTAGDESRIAGASVARTRWRVSPRPAPPEVRGPCWCLELTRNKGGPTGRWEVCWHDTAHRFDLVSQAAGRPAGAQDAA